MKLISALLLSALSSSLSTLSHAQGSLTPPPGPPAPTMKTLDQVEARTPVNATTTPGDAFYLFKITQPGSYYLTGNITAVAGKRGINITAAGVVLNLNGFTLNGQGADQYGSGVSVNAMGVSVRNGTISGWPMFGIDGYGGSSGSYSNITFIENGSIVELGYLGGGIATGGGSTVVDCLFVKNVTGGLLANPGGLTVSRCSARNNGGTGFFTNATATIDQCTASGNNTGFDLSSGSIATRCSASDNLLYGFSVSAGSLVDCNAYSNNDHGIKATYGSTIRGCRAENNGVNSSGSGIYASDLSTIENCVVDGNMATGITAGNHCAVRRCTSIGNKSAGIATLAYAVIENCTATSNGTDGISTNGGSLVRECTAMKNGTAAAAAGIHIIGSGSRIEGNNVRDNTGTGILATAGDLILRNSSGGNSVTNYSPSSGAGFAPLQSLATQTNPNANL